MSGALCQVIGCGPAALGARPRGGPQGRAATSPWPRGRRSSTAHRPPRPLSGLRFPFLIDANSVGRDFFAGVRADGAFAAALHGRAGRQLRERHDRGVPLRLVGAFLNDLSRAVEDVLPDGFTYGADVRGSAAIATAPGRAWTGPGRHSSRPESVVLATGGYEDTARVCRRYGVPPGRLIGSSPAAVRAARRGRPGDRLRWPHRRPRRLAQRLRGRPAPARPLRRRDTRRRPGPRPPQHFALLRRPVRDRVRAGRRRRPAGDLSGVGV
ncbi:hypothetical protein LT493_13485 [Streptomyces tricolor]|nr:hypothetical protein [Streptomyces tricolor]